MAESTRTIRAGGRGPDGPDRDAPTQQLSLTAVGDRCVNCGAPLASDQRYCVNCGERRGKPRFTLAAPEPATQTTTTRGPLSPRRLRTSAGMNLIAGVATLLIAMGVGVLIGHNNSPAQGSAKTQTSVINLGGTGASSGGSAGTAASTGASSGGTSGGGKSHKGKGHSHSSKAAAASAPPKVVVQKAAAAASKVTGGNAKLSSPTVTQGASCQNGTAGCQNGKFTGNNFFGQ